MLDRSLESPIWRGQIRPHGRKTQKIMLTKWLFVASLFHFRNCPSCGNCASNSNIDRMSPIVHQNSKNQKLLPLNYIAPAPVPVPTVPVSTHPTPNPTQNLDPPIIEEVNEENFSTFDDNRYSTTDSFTYRSVNYI